MVGRRRSRNFATIARARVRVAPGIKVLLADLPGGFGQKVAGFFSVCRWVIEVFAHRSAGLRGSFGRVLSVSVYVN